MAKIPTSLQPPKRAPTIGKRTISPKTTRPDKTEEQIPVELTETEKQKFIEDYKKQLKKESLERINQEIKKVEAEAQVANKTSQQKTGSTAERADQRKAFLDQVAGTLKQSKQYATGEYNIDEVIAYSYAKASNRQTRFELNKEKDVKFEQIKKEIPKPPEGYQGVTTREGVVFEKTPEKGKKTVEEFKREFAPTKEQALKQFPDTAKKTKYKDIDFILPYQERGTVSTIPSKGEVPKSIGEPPSGFDFITGAISKPADIVEEKIFQKEQALKKETMNLFVPTPTYQKPEFARKESVKFGQTPLSIGGEREKFKQEELVREEVILIGAEQKAEEISEKNVNKLAKTIENYNQKNPNKPLTEPQFNSLVKQTEKDIQSEVKTEMKKLRGKYEKDFTQREKEKVEELEKREFSEGFVERRISNIIRGGAYTIPIYGQLLFGSDVARTAKDAPELISYARKRPLEFGIETASTLAVFGAVGGGIGKLKSNIKQKKISQALTEAEVKITTKGKLTELELKKFEITKQQKLEIQNLLEEGYTIRKAEISLKPKSGLEKFTPKVKGEVIEVVNQFGEVSKRISKGKIEAKFEGKTVSQNIYAESLFKLESEGKVTGYTEMIKITPKKAIIGIEGGEKFPRDKATLNRFYEESKLTGLKESKKGRMIRTEFEARLLGTEKYTGEKLFTKYEKLEPSELKKASKPVSKGEFIEIQKLKRTEGVKIGGEQGLLLIKRIYGTRGFGKSRTVKDVPKKTRQPSTTLYKSFEEVKPEKALTKYEQPDVSGLVYKQVKDTKQAGRTIPKSEFEGKSYLVPYASETIYADFSSGLPKTFSRGGLRGAGLGVGVGVGFAGINISRDLRRTIQTVKPDVMDKDIEQTRVKTGLDSGLIERQRNEFDTKLSPVQVDFFAEDTIQRLNTAQVQPQALKQKSKFEQKFEFQQPVPPYIPPQPLSFEFTDEIKIGFPEFQRKKDGIKEQGYDAFAKVDATKKRKTHYKKLNTKPLTRKSAASLTARYVDNNISARGKISESKSKTRPINTNDKYYQRNQHKFRQFKQKKGVKERIPNQIIELQRYRLDKIGETRKLREEKSSTKRFFGF